LRRYEQILVEIVLFEREVGHFERKFQGEWGSSTKEFRRQKTRYPGLSRDVVCVILRLAVLIQYRRVTHTHTQTHDDGYYPRIACAARVKIADLNLPHLCIHIHDHFINATGSQKVSCLCLLDLSVAFAHNIFITRLSYLIIILVRYQSLTYHLTRSVLNVITISRPFVLPLLVFPRLCSRPSTLRHVH